MIKRIEIWDFECHEHTTIDGISPAVNLFCGESNSGKTSIIRALRLAALNQFDPRSVRTGASKCVVIVETERGSVKVTRGPKHNLWEVTPKGGSTQYFDKVGANIVPAAADIIGLNLVRLGDIDIPVNIMDQLESHFMLSGVGDKDATGSMRAQIIDEISGLSGIEGLIKDVSLDRHRFGREVTETEKTMEDTRARLHDQKSLDAEKNILEPAERDLSDGETILTVVASSEELVRQAQLTYAGLMGCTEAIRAIPDTDKAKEFIDSASTLTEKERLATRKIESSSEARRKASVISGSLSSIPDVESAVLEMKGKDDLIAKIGAGERIVSVASTTVSRLKAAEGRVSKIEASMDTLNAEVSVANAKVGSVNKASSLLAGLRQLESRVATAASSLSRAESSLGSVEGEIREMLKSVEVCPLTMKPIGDYCREQMK